MLLHISINDFWPLETPEDQDTSTLGTIALLLPILDHKVNLILSKSILFHGLPYPVIF